MMLGNTELARRLRYALIVPRDIAWVNPQFGAPSTQLAEAGKALVHVPVPGVNIGTLFPG